MQREVVPRRPDAIMRPAGSGVEIMTGSRQDLIVKVARGKKRGEFAPRGVSAIVRVPNTELWAVKVIRVKPPAPAWIRPAIIAGSILTVVALALSLLAYATKTAAEAMGAAFGLVPDVDVPTMIVLGVISSILMAALRRQMVEVIVRVWK